MNEDGLVHSSFQSKEEPMGDQKTNAASSYPTTQWTQIIEVIQRGDSDAAGVALGEFCERYRPAIYNFFRQRGKCSHEEAEDHTQAFFASRILEGWDRRNGFLHTAQRGEQTRFRSFLCHVLWRFLQDEWKRTAAKKAGGGVAHVPLDDLELFGGPADPRAFESFGQKFDRVFAQEIIQRAAERSKHSRHLMAHLRGEISQQEAAQELGLTENAFKQAHHRFRERLALDLWEEVGKLVGPDENEIRAELKYLMSLFAQPAS